MSRSQLKNNIENRTNNSYNIPFSIKGRVYSVILDEEHFFFTDVLGKYDKTYIGWIYWGNLNLKQGGLSIEDIKKYCTLAKPYNNNITYHPLKTEIIELVKAPSNNHYAKFGGSSTNAEYYYHPPINIWNNSSFNALPSETDFKNSNETLLLGSYTDETSLSLINNLLPFEGDMILEGRFGNSIRFGSSNPQGKNNWSNNDSNGEPITIISNGQSSGDTPLEDINNDPSSIYLTSNQNIDNFNIASKNFTSLNVGFKESLEPDEIPTIPPSSEILNGTTLITPTLETTGPITENQPSPLTDDELNLLKDESPPLEGEGFEDLVKIPGKYQDNNKILRDLYLIPKRFTSGFSLITDILAKPLMRMLLAAEKEGVKLKINSGFRPPVDDIFINKKLIQKSQKAVRLENLKSKYKNKIKEPWLERSIVIEPFDGYQPGDLYNVTPQSKHFRPLTAASYKSPHGDSKAVDFSTSNASNKQYKWLCKNGWKYGFIRTVSSEPWHFGYQPDRAKNGPTALLEYSYEPGRSYENTTNRWNNVFGDTEPNWGQELVLFEEQEAQKLNDTTT